MPKTLTISPITRLEGHGKIDILLDEAGDVQDAYLQVVELRGFERFCQGRPVEEMPRLTPKICGVCPGSHHMASAKAGDAVYGLTIPETARKLRELFLNAHIAHSHILHFFALAAPDFVPGAGAAKSRRNILGLVDELGLELGRAVIENRGRAQRIQGIIAGHPIHPVAALPGGMAKRLREEERREIVDLARQLEAFSATALELFEADLLQRPDMCDGLGDEKYHHETYYAGLVDDKGRVNFYDGEVRVVAPDGSRLTQFAPADYRDHISERVVPWSYLKIPYLRKVGWQGLVDGPQSGVFRVNALARLNVADGMATGEAQMAFARLFAHFGHKPVHHTLAYHWARLVELRFAAERVLELARDTSLTHKEVRVLPDQKPGVGVGVVEAPRGTLYHHYETDGHGLLKLVNLIVATGQNNAAMNMSVKKAAQGLIKNGQVSDELLNRVEMAFRAYDPCLACATHTLPGHMPLEINLYQGNELVRRLARRPG